MGTVAVHDGDSPPESQQGVRASQRRFVTGGEVNARSNAGATAFEMAAARGHAEVCIAIHSRADFDAAGGRIIGGSSVSAFAAASMPRAGYVKDLSGHPPRLLPENCDAL